MLTSETFKKIISIYERYHNDITLCSNDEIKLLINLFIEHPILADIKASKGYSIIQKTIYKLKIEEQKRDEEVLNYDEENK